MVSWQPIKHVSTANQTTLLCPSDKQVATTSNSEIHWQLDRFTQAVRSAPFNYDRYCKSNKFNSFKEWYIQHIGRHIGRILFIRQAGDDHFQLRDTAADSF